MKRCKEMVEGRKIYIVETTRYYLLFVTKNICGMIHIAGSEFQEKYPEKIQDFGQILEGCGDVYRPNITQLFTVTA